MSEKGCRSGADGLYKPLTANPTQTRMPMNEKPPPERASTTTRPVRWLAAIGSLALIVVLLVLMVSAIRSPIRQLHISDTALVPFTSLHSYHEWLKSRGIRDSRPDNEIIKTLAQNLQQAENVPDTVTEGLFACRIVNHSQKTLRSVVLTIVVMDATGRKTRTVDVTIGNLSMGPGAARTFSGETPPIHATPGYSWDFSVKQATFTEK